MYTIENDMLSVSVKTKGAELDSIYGKSTNIEYLWDGNPKYWNKKSPVLFPIVGTLKNNTYYFRNQAYQLGRHGFARDREFICSSHEQSKIVMSLLSDEQTSAVYPFPFRLDVIYKIDNDCLKVKYRVTNTGENDMYFSFGAHPAFRVPLEAQFSYDDYYLEFEKSEFAMRWPISRGGLIEAMPERFLEDEKIIRLNKDLFLKDAIVLKHLNSDVISLRTKRSEHGLEFHWPRFPYLGIWAAPGADFVCLEPWCGIADSVTHNQELEKKEGINFLAGGATFERTWAVRVF